jgi:hypothetical protein
MIVFASFLAPKPPHGGLIVSHDDATAPSSYGRRSDTSARDRRVSTVQADLVESQMMAENPPPPTKTEKRAARELEFSAKQRDSAWGIQTAYTGSSTSSVRWRRQHEQSWPRRCLLGPFFSITALGRHCSPGALTCAKLGRFACDQELFGCFCQARSLRSRRTSRVRRPRGKAVEGPAR